MRIMIHGGFFSESTQNQDIKTQKQEALKSVILQAFDFLQDHSAKETAVFAVTLLENDPLFNAGTGSQIQSDGVIRMSASLMDGETQCFSGVMNIERVKNPVQVAEKLQAEKDRVLGGMGARNFASENDFEDFCVETPQRKEEYLLKLQNGRHGTVGCVVRDKKGRLAAATSTGGKGFEIAGRISDSATVAGNYANNFCAVSCTGIGEDIVSNATAAKIVTRVTDGVNIENAFDRTFEELKEIKGMAGAIGIDGDGNMYHLDSVPTMVFAGYDGVDLEIFR